MLSIEVQLLVLQGVALEGVAFTRKQPHIVLSELFLKVVECKPKLRFLYRPSGNICDLQISWFVRRRRVDGRWS